MTINSINELMTFKGRRVWCVRHIVIQTFGDVIETSRSILTEWHVGPFICLRSPVLRSRGGVLINPTPFEVADQFSTARRAVHYNVDFVDAKRCLHRANVLALSAYLPDLRMLTPFNHPLPGRSAMFASEDEAQSRQVFIALDGEPDKSQHASYDLEQVGRSIESMPDDLYSRTGRWTIPSSG